MKKANSNKFSSTKIATIQNFYDPFQNTPNAKIKSPMSKGLHKFSFKIDDISTCNKTTTLGKESLIPLELESTFRKNSIDQKSNREKMNPNDSNEYLPQGLPHTNVRGNKSNFFKTHKKLKYY